MLSALLVILVLMLVVALAAWKDSQSGGAHPVMVKLSRPK
jgi:hypothetical protein